jgi:hypothetical protein
MKQGVGQHFSDFMQSQEVIFTSLPVLIGCRLSSSWLSFYQVPKELGVFWFYSSGSLTGMFSLRDTCLTHLHCPWSSWNSPALTS